MRPLFSSLLAVGLLSSHLAAAQCARSSERTAFDVEELKSELMVTAISCKANDEYNQFMGRYKGDIAGDEKTIDGYFHRAYGRQGQKEHDEYITNLANAQSQQGMKQGTAFCDERQGMFSEVMALPSANDLADYARGKNLVSPVDFETCTGPEPVVKTHGGRRSTHHVAKAKH